MKKIFEIPELEVLKFTTEDTMVASGGSNGIWDDELDERD